MYLTHIDCPPEVFHYLFPHQALLEESAGIDVCSESRNIRKKEWHKVQAIKYNGKVQFTHLNYHKSPILNLQLEKRIRGPSICRNRTSLALWVVLYFLKNKNSEKI
jgi:hypothetical protein